MARLIQTGSARQPFCNLPRDPYFPQVMSRNPTNTTDMAYHVLMVWAGPRSLATTSGVAFCFTFLQVLRCFNSLGWLQPPMNSAEDRRGLPGGVSPFGDPRVACIPANRGLSQVATSFIASQCQGIHHTPLLAWSKKFLTLYSFSDENVQGGTPDSSSLYSTCSMLSSHSTVKDRCGP